MVANTNSSLLYALFSTKVLFLLMEYLGGERPFGGLGAVDIWYIGERALAVAEESLVPLHDNHHNNIC